MGQRFARAGGRVDVLIEAAKADPSTAELLDRPDQMAKASTHPVESPHHEGIPFAKQGECQLQLRELCLAPARHVDKELVDVCFVQGLFLNVKALPGLETRAYPMSLLISSSSSPPEGWRPRDDCRQELPLMSG